MQATALAQGNPLLNLEEQAQQGPETVILGRRRASESCERDLSRLVFWARPLEYGVNPKVSLKTSDPLLMTDS